MKQVSSIPHVTTLMIFDRVNEIPGSYYVGYTDEDNTRWYWNQSNGGTFEEFGTLIVGEDAANALLHALRRAHNFYTAGKTTIADLNARNHELESLLSQVFNETHDHMRKLESANKRVAELEAANIEVRTAIRKLLEQFSESHDELLVKLSI